MGIPTIVQTFKRSAFKGDLSLAFGEEEEKKKLVVVEFQIFYGEKKFHSPLSAPGNNPYTLTGEERTNYRKIWEDVCRVTNGDPFQYLKREEIRDYSSNIPNALHLLVGWMQDYTKLITALNDENLELKIAQVGTHPYDPATVEAINQICDRYPWLYKGFRFGDVEGK